MLVLESKIKKNWEEKNCMEKTREKRRRNNDDDNNNNKIIKEKCNVF